VIRGHDSAGKFLASLGGQNGYAGPDGTGHVFLYEFPPNGLPRRDRKALEAAISRMSSSVSSLSRMQRGALVRAASYR